MTETGDDFQRWVDGLLTSPAAKPIAPPELKLEVAHALGRRRGFQTVRRVAAAAVLLGALAMWLPGEGHRLDRPVAPRSGPATNPAEWATRPMATFVAGPDQVAVSRAGPAPNVTVVEFYPTTSAQKRWRRQSYVRSLRNRIRQGADAS